MEPGTLVFWTSVGTWNYGSLSTTDSLSGVPQLFNQAQTSGRDGTPGIQA